MRSEFSENILCVLKENNLAIEGKDFSNTSNLQEYGLDSITFIKIIVALEEIFECEIPYDKLMISEMNTVEKISNVLSDIKTN